MSFFAWTFLHFLAHCEIVTIFFREIAQHQYSKDHQNDEDEIEFIITISDGRNCDPTQNPGKEEEGLYLLIHKYTTQGPENLKKSRQKNS